MRARTIVAVGRYEQGEELFGDTAEKAVEAGWAVEVPPAVAEEEEAPEKEEEASKKGKGKKSPEAKKLDAAPENK